MMEKDIRSDDYAADWLNVGGFWDNGFPVIPSKVFRTAQGRLYLKEPGIAMISKPNVNLNAVAEFLKGFDDKDFEEYLSDPTKIEMGAALSKYAGQICYMAVGEKRTKNSEAERYFDNIFAQEHESILEHAYYVFQIWGVDRSFTHELVRHRVGVSYSQVSQRYVGPDTLRFVERPERQNLTSFPDEIFAELHQEFEDEINEAANRFEARVEVLMQPKYLEKFGWDKIPARDRRKAVQQFARDFLPNCVEAPIVFGVNIRQLRHMLGLRGNRHADLPIREVSYRLFLCLAQMEPLLFRDRMLKHDVQPPEICPIR